MHQVSVFLLSRFSSKRPLLTRATRLHSKYEANTYDELSPDILCHQDIWREYAAWLMDHDVETETEKKGGTIVVYVRKVFTIARDQYGRQPKHAAFFEPTLDPTSALNWFKGMTRQIFVKSWQDAMDRGEPSSKQADAIGLQERRDFFRSLSTEGSRDSLKRLTDADRSRLPTSPRGLGPGPNKRRKK